MADNLNLKQIAGNFSRGADNYQQHAILQEMAAQKLVKLAASYQLNDTNILDLGSGTGNIYNFLQQKFDNFTLDQIDLSPKMLEKSKASNKICGDFHDSKLFVCQKYHYVFSSFALQWCNDLKLVLKNIFFSLKDGGLLFLCCPDFLSLAEIKKANIASNCNFSLIDLPKNQDYVNFAENCGFKTIKNDQQNIKISYKNAIDCLKSIKKIGANYNLRHKNIVFKKNIKKFNDFFNNYHQNNANWCVNYFIFKK